MYERKEGQPAKSFFKTHQKTITRICREEAKKFAYRVRRYEKCLTVDDLIQEALMQVFLKSESFDEARAKEGEEGFIHSCAHSAIIDTLRRHGGEIDKTSDEEQSEYIIPALLPENYAHPCVENTAFQGESKAVDLLGHLHGHQRVIVELKFGINVFCEHSDEAIARELGLSRPTVKKELNRALHEMRQYVNSENKGIAA